MIDLYLHQQALDTSTPSGRALFGMLGVFSEFERAMIRDRVMAGLDRARSSGKRLGRPRTTPFTVQRIRAALDGGRGVRETAVVEVSAAKVRGQAYVGGGCMSGTFSRAYGRTSSVWLKSAKPTAAR
jgi:DNA invertase Pin-like site-specific DNA recombinase